MARYPSTVMVSIVCPWDRRERLAEQIFRRAIRHAAGMGFDHLYVFGTAGEGYAVDGARFRSVIEVFRDETVGSAATPMVGVIGLSTANVLERLRVAYDLGFREFQISHGVPKSEAYNITMYIMAGLLVIALFANLAVRRVAARYHEGSRPRQQQQKPGIQPATA